MAVDILVAGRDDIAFSVLVRARVVLLVAEAVKYVLSCIYIVEMDGIYRGDIAAVHEDIGVTCVRAAIRVVEVLVASVHLQSCLEP